MGEVTVATKQMIEQLFDEAAEVYDNTGPSIFSQYGKTLADRIPLSDGAQVLDIATGSGAVLLPLAKQLGSDGHVTGIDLSEGILQEAKKNVAAQGLSSVSLRKMDAEQLDFPDQTFDAISCAFSIFLFPDLDKALSEMHRTCKRGGSLCISVFNNNPFPFDPGWTMLFQQIFEYENITMMPQQVAYSEEELKTLLSSLEFSKIETHVETNEVVFESEDDWWNFQMTLGPRLTLLDMDEETRSRFKDEYFEKIRPLFKSDGLHLSTSVS